MPKPLALFDFDGTIVDTLPFLINIYNDIAPEYGCKTVTMEEAQTLRDKRPQEFMREYGVTWWKLPKLVLRSQREMQKNLDRIEAQPGMLEAIKSIKAAGFEVAIMTSNAQKNAEAVLKRLDILEDFKFVHASKHLFGKHRVLKKIRKRYGPAVYVGDETRDIEASKKINMPVIAVTWGFNKKHVLESTNPDHVADSPDQLIEILQTYA